MRLTLINLGDGMWWWTLQVRGRIGKGCGFARSRAEAISMAFAHPF